MNFNKISSFILLREATLIFGAKFSSFFFWAQFQIVLRLHKQRFRRRNGKT
ncbi:hypothetical protein DB44_FF00010 [Candidatus Protochlamydia amoebophila]|uniref:Uncharacterized protein n=1 Tax=Candidatus Protochlamydia amoebophila TaxID=362787 RepID=A0A0C1JHM9_9BACT|nr:hypothetical protein DB44_FF00010 [Candidatus Protochlamydia amoebophila]